MASDPTSSSTDGAPTGATSPKTHFILGSRSSELAMIQARHVLGLLQTAHPDKTFEIKQSSSHGDKDQTKSLAALAAGNPGLFTKDLELGLISGAYDFAVHSLKDMPTSLPEGLDLVAITEREDPHDALVVHPKHKGCGSVEALPSGAVVGTSSLRRHALLKRKRPDLDVRSIRGNLNTRFKKLDEGYGGEHFDAVILAAAGLKRMGWEGRIEAILDAKDYPYGVGQGALGIECRANDTDTIAVLQAVVDPDTSDRCLAERAFLRRLQGGCQVPIAVASSIDRPSAKLSLSGLVMSNDGSVCIEDSLSLGLSDETTPKDVGERLADALIEKGGLALLRRELGERPITYGSAEQAGAAEVSPAVAAATGAGAGGASTSTA